MKRSIALILAVLVFASFAFAQNKAALQIQCNQSGAQVYVNGRLMGTTTPNLALLLPAGSYQIRLSKKGYNDFNTTVVLPSGGTALTVTLLPKGSVAPQPAPPPQPVQPATFGLTVNASQPFAEVFINGRSYGRAPVSTQVMPGTYSVVVRAPNMLEWSQTVSVTNAPVVLSASMRPQSNQLTVNANVAGAQVFINGNPAGQTPFSTQLPPGSYSIIIKAPGYLDYSQSFVMNGPQVIAASLQPATAMFQVSIPPSAVNTDLKGGHWSQIQIYVDGVLQRMNGNASLLDGQLFPGRRVIRIVAGGLAAETVIDVQAGRTYSIEPFLGITVK